MSHELYFDDFEVGQVFKSKSARVTKEEIISYAKQYDPQYFHTDEEAAKKSAVGQLFASGWLVASISMRLKLGTAMGKVAGGLIGMGLDSLKWISQVYANDVIHVVVTITEKRVSASKPSQGIMKYRAETFNQHDVKVCEATAAVWVPVKLNS